MKNELIPFKFEHHEVRTIVIDGEPWFSAKDVCDALSFANSRDAVSRLEDYEKLVSEIPTPGQMRKVQLVNESGVLAGEVAA